MHGGQRYDVAHGMGAAYGVAQPPHGWTTSFPREAPSSQGVVAGRSEGVDGILYPWDSKVSRLVEGIVFSSAQTFGAQKVLRLL